MKRFLKVFVLTRPEQRLILVLVLLLVAAAWFKHHGDRENSARPLPAPSASPSPQGYNPGM